MAVTTPLMIAVASGVQIHALNAEFKRTVSPDEDINSQLLDGFLASCTRTAPTHLPPTKTVPSHAFSSPILTLPLIIIKNILRRLLTSPHPLVLQPDSITTSQVDRAHVESTVLQVCKVFHNVGVPILYGENTLTTSSPATSYDFDTHLLSLPGRKRQLITAVRLEIDWADQLWAKFPLVARALGELKFLAKLEIVIVEKGEMVEEDQEASIEKDASLNIAIAYGQCPPATDRASHRMKREGSLADAMLKAEMKMLKDLVGGFKGLKHFRLRGFRHEVFAWCLEEHVRMGNH